MSKQQLEDRVGNIYYKLAKPETQGIGGRSKSFSFPNEPHIFYHIFPGGAILKTSNGGKAFQSLNEQEAAKIISVLEHNVREDHLRVEKLLKEHIEKEVKEKADKAFQEKEIRRELSYIYSHVSKPAQLELGGKGEEYKEFNLTGSSDLYRIYKNEKDVVVGIMGSGRTQGPWYSLTDDKINQVYMNILRSNGGIEDPQLKESQSRAGATPSNIFNPTELPSHPLSGNNKNQNQH